MPGINFNSLARHGVLRRSDAESEKGSSSVIIQGRKGLPLNIGSLSAMGAALYLEGWSTLTA